MADKEGFPDSSACFLVLGSCFPATATRGHPRAQKAGLPDACRSHSGHQMASMSPHLQPSPRQICPNHDGHQRMPVTTHSVQHRPRSLCSLQRPPEAACEQPDQVSYCLYSGPGHQMAPCGRLMWRSCHRLRSPKWPPEVACEHQNMAFCLSFPLWPLDGPKWTPTVDKPSQAQICTNHNVHYRALVSTESRTTACHSSCDP